MRELRFVCAQPATLFYAWQVEVMINNFVEMGINPNHIDVVCWKQNNVIPDQWSKLANTYPARFFFYDETRATRHYISSIRPNLLKQHWTAHPYLKDSAIFYHDSDIIFSMPVSRWITQEMINDEEWYGSNTNSYISHSYIKSKGDDVIAQMCEITGLSESLIKINDNNSIGAQYLMKNVTYEYWNRVEIDCELLFKDITELNNRKVVADRIQWDAENIEWMKNNTDAVAKGEKYSRPLYHELQIWCADMWAVLWGAWRLGFKTNCHQNFDFSWATSSQEEFYKLAIMHNAGATTSADGLFYKGEHMNDLPYNKDLKIKEGTASKCYWDWIQKVGKKSCLI